MTLWQDIRFGFRMMRKSPGFTAGAVFALAMGIAANTAIFSIVNAVLLRPLPFRDPSRLIMIWEKRPQQGFDWLSVSSANYADWRDQSTVFERTAAARNWNVTRTGTGAPEQLIGMRASGEFFQLLGVGAAEGRTFLPEEDTPGREHVVVLSHGLWRRAFASDPSIVGRAIKLNGEEYSVVGVLPEDFQFASRDVELFAPLALGQSGLDRETRANLVFARLKPGVSIEQARAEMESISRRLAEQYPETNRGYSVAVYPMHDFFANLRNLGTILLILQASVGFLLLISCVNVANLLLARGAHRQRELAVRTALGASRLRVVRQLLTESLLLGLMSGATGLLLAFGLFRLLVAITPYIPTFRPNAVAIDFQEVAFTLGVSIVTGLVFGLAPALRSSKLNLADTLKEGGKGSLAGSASQRVRALLVISEVTLATVLLIGAALALRSFQQLQQVKPGFETSDILTAQISLPAAKYRKPEQVASFFRKLLEARAEMPAARDVSLTSQLPLSGLLLGVTDFTPEGAAPRAQGQELNANDRTVSADYFKTLGVRLLSGRFFNEHDAEGTTPVVIVNQALAARCWPGENPVGKHLKFGGDSAQTPLHEIVGVVGNVKDLSLEAEPRPEIYRHYLQNPSPAMVVLARGPGNAEALAAPLREAVMRIDADQPVAQVRTMEQVLARSVAPRRFSMLLLGVLACVALLLAATGIYGVISYSVAQRRREIGIRLALGAPQRKVFGLVVMQGMRPVLIGIGLGLALGFLLSRLASSLVFGVAAVDPPAFIVTALVFALVAFLANYLPARRAARISPLVAMRE